MKHPIHFIVAGSGGCVVVGIIAFMMGIFLDKSLLKSIGIWVWLVGFIIASIPLLGYTVLIIIEKFRGK